MQRLKKGELEIGVFCGVLILTYGGNEHDYKTTKHGNVVPDTVGKGTEKLTKVKFLIFLTVFCAFFKI